MHALRNKFILSGLLIFCCRLISAQIFPYWRYTTADELASSTVNDIFQDGKGYLWFATDRGVSRFDGFKFNNYLYAEGLPDAKIKSFADNSEGKVIAAIPYKGAELFGNNFAEMIPPSELAPNDDCIATENAFYSLRYGEYISVITKSKGSTTKIDINAIPYCIIPGNNEILAATSNGLCHISADGNFKFDTGLTEPIFSLYKSDGKLYASGNSAIYTQNGSGIFEKNIIPVEGPIANLLFSRKGEFWFTASGNNIIFKYAGGKLFDISEKLQIKGTKINKLFEDHEGNIWVATTGKGAICIHHFFTTNYSKIDGLENEYITSLHLNGENDLVVRTVDGIFELNDLGIQKLEGKAGDQDQNHISTRPELKGELSRLKLNDLHRVISLLHHSKNKFDQYNRNYADSNDSLSILEVVNDIFVDNENRIWIATTNGLISSANIKTDTTFLDVNISCITPDKKNNIYFGTDNGLAKLSGDNWKFYTQLKGKNIESITSIVLDNKNRLWIGTLTGLSMWDQEKLFQFDTKNILLSDEVNALCFDAKSNRIWAGTSSGLSRIDVSQLDSSTIYAPLPMFKNLRTEDSIYRELDLKKEITLPFNSRNFALRYSAIHFSTPEGVKFYYKFDDGDWQPATGRQIEFASIPYGKHTFLLKAIGEQDLEGPPASLVVYVQTPFWATNWFKIILGVLIVFLAYLSIRKRFEVVKKKQQERLELQAKIAELRHQALAASMNPHFIFNALNSIQQFINVHDTEEASEFLGKFARLIRIMLKSGGKTFITLKEELERLNYYLDLEKIRFGNKLNFEIDVDEKIAEEQTEIPNMVIQPIVENALWHGLLPANRDGFLKISFSKMNGSIHVLVDDNGIGVNESKKRKKSGHVSLGLQMIEERLALLNKLNGYKGSISIRDKSELIPSLQGTQVDIVLS